MRAPQFAALAGSGCGETAAHGDTYTHCLLLVPRRLRIQVTTNRLPIPVPMDEWSAKCGDVVIPRLMHTMLCQQAFRRFSN